MSKRQQQRERERTMFQYYELPGVLPKGRVLVVNAEVRTPIYTLITLENVFLEQRLFTFYEHVLLEALLRNFPHHTPHEEFLSLMSGDARDLCRQIMHEALEEGTFDDLMRPTRNLLSRGRRKLRSFGIEISSVFEMGYALFPLSASRRFLGVSEEGEQEEHQDEEEA